MAKSNSHQGSKPYKLFDMFTNPNIKQERSSSPPTPHKGHNHNPIKRQPGVTDFTMTPKAEPGVLSHRPAKIIQRSQSMAEDQTPNIQFSFKSERVRRISEGVQHTISTASTSLTASRITAVTAPKAIVIEPKPLPGWIVDNNRRRSYPPNPQEVETGRRIRYKMENSLGYEPRLRHRHTWQERRQKDMMDYVSGRKPDRFDDDDSDDDKYAEYRW